MLPANFGSLSRSTLRRQAPSQSSTHDDAVSVQDLSDAVQKTKTAATSTDETAVGAKDKDPRSLEIATTGMNNHNDDEALHGQRGYRQERWGTPPYDRAASFWRKL